MRDFIAVVHRAAGRPEIVSPERIDRTQGLRVRVEGGSYRGIDGICVRDNGQCKVAVVIDPVAAVLTSHIPERYLQLAEGVAAHTADSE